MEEKIEIDGKNYVDVMMPGFRFHPTDEELVGFYLKRKIQQRPLPVELIKQVDIYKYDPWDLPKLAATGEKDWYFYCPRDRKYRNSARPNRVTGSGFWKATGRDRPIYSCDGTKRIGLKKSLVFYRGKAARGIKTDWMMHEFRLPSLGGDHSPPKELLDKSFPPNDAWAICRIFKKTNSKAQKPLSNSWVSPFGDFSPSNIITHQFNSENISCTTEIGPIFHLSSTNTSDIPPSCKIIDSTIYKPSFPISNERVGNLQDNFMFSPTKLLNPAMIGEVNNEYSLHNFEGSQENFNSFSLSLHQDVAQNNLELEEADVGFCQVSSSIPENIPSACHQNSVTIGSKIWPWDSPPCPSEISTSYSTNTCYT